MYRFLRFTIYILWDSIKSSEIEQYFLFNQGPGSALGLCIAGPFYMPLILNQSYVKKSVER